MEKLAPPTLKQAESWAVDRYYSLCRQDGKFKIPPSTFRKEIVLAMILGEISGVERVLRVMNEGKDDLNLDLLKGDIHLFLMETHNLIMDHFGVDKEKVQLEDFLFGRFSDNATSEAKEAPPTEAQK